MIERHYYAVEYEKTDGGLRWDADVHVFRNKAARDFWAKYDEYDKQRYHREKITSKEFDELHRDHRVAVIVRHDIEKERDA